MSKFAIAFVVPDQNNSIKHRCIESESKDKALRTFFDDELTSFYSNDEQGYFYFKEDFSDSVHPSGSIIEC